MNALPRKLASFDTFRSLSRSRDFLAANCNESVQLVDAAAAACLSPFHYHCLFAQAFGETPHEFVTRIRLERARSLLAAEHLSVTNVCLEVGYSSLGSFSTWFRATTGMSPSEYRREVRRVYQSAEIRPFRFIPACFVAL